jgi:hypothetical protein
MVQKPEAREALKAFESFLEGLDLRGYEQKYRPIKTVEQDLPPELNPLPDLYENYWKPGVRNPSFPSYEEFFEAWWQKRVRSSALDAFIRKYFWGCSYNFVQLGLEARLYRTATSIWTQFHLCYRWQASCTSKLGASWEMDKQGIDALVYPSEDYLVGLQVKKETYRSEARSQNRFLKKQMAVALVEVPYTLTPESELIGKIQRARSNQTRYKYQLWAKVASHLLSLPNGFVIFQESYVRHLENFLKEKGSSLKGTVSWETVAKEAL